MSDMASSETDIYAASFFLADHVVAESGKLYVNGGFWNRLTFPSYPAVTHFGVGSVLVIPWRAYHQAHNFAIWFEDPDAKRVGGELGGEFTVGAAPDMKVGDETVMPIAAMINNFSFESSGDFAAVLAVDGTELARWKFRAAQVPFGFQPAFQVVDGAEN